MELLEGHRKATEATTLESGTGTLGLQSLGLNAPGRRCTWKEVHLGSLPFTLIGNCSGRQGGNP